MSTAKSRSSSGFREVHCKRVLLPALSSRPPARRSSTRAGIPHASFPGKWHCQLPVMENLTGGIFIQLLDDGDELWWKAVVLHQSPDDVSVDTIKNFLWFELTSLIPRCFFYLKMHFVKWNKNKNRKKFPWIEISTEIILWDIQIFMNFVYKN